MQKNGRGSNSPWWLELVSFVVQLPFKIVLAILQFISDLLVAKHAPAETKSVGRGTDAQFARGAESVRNTKTETRSKKVKKPKRRSVKWRIAAIICWVIDAFVWCMALEEAVAGNSAGALSNVSMGIFCTAAAVLCTFMSTLNRRREENMARYLAVIGERDSVSLARLAEASRLRIPLVRRELQTMIDDGMFGSRAYIDLTNECFMRYPEALPDVQMSRQEPAKENESSIPGREDDEYAAILAEICALDDAIADEAVSARIVRIEMVTRHIFEYVTDHPERKQQIRTFMNYYLPTTLKLLRSYSSIERVGTAGKNMRETKENIERTLDTLVRGFESQLDLLYGSENVDISSDIEVLEQMMSRDGLKENTDFTPTDTDT